MSRNVISERVLGMPRERTSTRTSRSATCPVAPRAAEQGVVRVGFHLPQFGKAITTGGIQRAAVRAEELGFDDVWVSDHLVIPAAQSYPAPYIYDPLMSLAFVAAVTDRIGLGTSVLVATQYPSPLAVANSLASLDHMSGGRLTVGAGIGWSSGKTGCRPSEPRSTAAVGAWREILELWRSALAVRSSQPRRGLLSIPRHQGPPQTCTRHPHMVGGNERCRHGQGGPHGRRLPRNRRGVEGCCRSRGEDPRGRAPTRPSPFPYGSRGTPASTTRTVRAQLAEYEVAGANHLHYAPDRGDLDTWISDMERLADQAGLSS